MTYVIAEPCVSTCDTACVEVCPVDCIHDQKIKLVLARRLKLMGLTLKVNNCILILMSVLIVEHASLNVQLRLFLKKASYLKNGASILKLMQNGFLNNNIRKLNT